MNGIIIDNYVYRAFEVKPNHKAKGVHRCKMCIFVVRCAVMWEDKNKPCQGFAREVYFSGSPKYTKKLKTNDNQHPVNPNRRAAGRTDSPASEAGETRVETLLRSERGGKLRPRGKPKSLPRQRDDRADGTRPMGTCVGAPFKERQ